MLLALALLLGGCSNVKLAYSNGQQLAWWWVDDYFDFDREQAPRVHQAIERLFAWHRSTQLPGYAAWLDAVAARTDEPATGAQVCRWEDEIRARLEPTLEQALALAADVVPTMTEAQFRRLDQRYAKAIRKARDDYLQRDPDKRRKAAVKRAQDYAEKLYGTLGDAQQQVLEAGIAASPFDPERWIAERQRRQRDTAQTLRKLAADKPGHDRTVAALRALVARNEQSPDVDYRAYHQRVAEHNCALAAQLHNAAGPAQRHKARDVLRGWAADARSLAAGGG